MIVKLGKETCTPLSDPKTYQKLIRSLIYLTITRPNNTFVVGLISHFMQAPWKPHLEETKNILKYINCTLDLSLLYQKGSNFSLVSYSDVDFGGDMDDKRSNIWVCFPVWQYKCFSV